MCNPEEVLKLCHAIEDFDTRSWEFEGRSTDVDEGQEYVFYPQGSRLGDTAIILDYNYEECGLDCDFITLACENIKAFATEILVLRKQLDMPT